MCLTIPGKINSIKDGVAIVENGTRTEQIELGVVLDAKVGDWVLYATDRAVRKIDAVEAREIIELLEDNYQPVDIKALPLEYKKIIYKVRSKELKNLSTEEQRGDNDEARMKNDEQNPKPRVNNQLPITNNHLNSNLQISNGVIAKNEAILTDKKIAASRGKVGSRNENNLATASGLRRAQSNRGVPQNAATIQQFNNVYKQDLEYLLNLRGSNNLEALYSEANVLRKETIKDFVCIHGIIEFSNYCRNSCLYCGINKEANIRRYRMSEAEIFMAVKIAVEQEGYKLVVLQSGEDFSYTDDELIALINRIKKNLRVFIFISVGERSIDFYQRAFEAGASGSLFRFETSNPELYAKMHHGHSLKERLASLREQIRIGYYVASGGLIGLPGQSVSDMADDLLLVRDLGVPMLSSGPYLSSKNNLLENSKSQFLISNQIPNYKSKNINESVIPVKTGIQDNNDGSQIKSGMTDDEKLRLTLNYYAAARMLMPEIKIPVTTALETLDSESGRHKGLLAGANALMFNITPDKYRDDYNLYDHKYIEREKVWQKYGLFKGEESYEMLEERLQI